MMTIEKARADYEALIAQHGFTQDGEIYDGTPVYHRVWTKKVQVAWYGEHEDTLEIRIAMPHGTPLVSIKRNGRLDGLMRDYSSPKRAFNAIKEIAHCAGYEL